MEKEKEIKTPREYKIKKIEELKEKLPERWEEIAFKFLNFIYVWNINGVEKSTFQPLFSIMPIVVLTAFLNKKIYKYRNLMEIDKLETDLKLDRVTESEFIKILEDKKQELSELNDDNYSKFIFYGALGIISIISACALQALDAPMPLLSLVSAYGFLEFIDKNYEMREIDARINQVEEKQEIFELTRKRK